MNIPRKLLLVTTLLLALPGFGQIASAQEAASATSVRTLMELMGADEMGNLIVSRMLNNLAQTQGVAPELVEDLKESADVSALYDQLVPVYQKNISQADMDAAIAFFSSDAGRRFTKASKAITNESYDIGSAWGRKLAEDVMRRHRPQQ